jgi:hypothetical protein
MTVQTPIAAEADPVATARAALAIAQADYRKASVKYEKIDVIIEASEKRLATRQNDLQGYKHLDEDMRTASAKLLLKGGDLKLSEAINKNLAARDALISEAKILTDGLASLREQLATAYSDKKATYAALDDAAAAILRADTDTLATRLATILEEARTIGQQLRAYQSASTYPREKQDVHIGVRPCISDFGNQMLATVASPLSIDHVGEGARTRALVDFHTALIKDAAALEPRE